MKIPPFKIALPCGKIIFRSAKINEAGLLLQYFRQLFHESSDNLNYSGAYYDSRKEEEQRDFIQTINFEKLSFALFAFHEGAIVGHLVLKNFNYERALHRAMVVMGVLNAYQNKGIGRKLLEISIDTASAVGVFSLELRVRIFNEIAIQLYESMGFVRVGTITSAAKIGRSLFGEYIYVKD